jgi:hypothetical protein
MKEISTPDPLKITAELMARKKRRASEGWAKIENGAAGGQAYSLAYGVFSDSLSAAGLSRRLNPSPEEIRPMLVSAARACLEIYRWRGTLVSSITSLPSEEEDIFIDDTAANPDTFVSGVYAALAVDEDGLVEQFSRLSEIDQPPPRLSIVPELARFSSALHFAISGRFPQALTTLEPLQQARPADPGKAYWVVQAKALRPILLRDGPNAQKALEMMRHVQAKYYREMGNSISPDETLELPYLGLQGLERRIERSKAER